MVDATTIDEGVTTTTTTTTAAPEAVDATATKTRKKKPEDKLSKSSTHSRTSKNSKNSKNGRSSSPVQRPPVNNIALAAMLRESATFVEKGEFDPILYQALTDFRNYYKEHYPKKKESGSSGTKGKKPRVKRSNSKTGPSDPAEVAPTENGQTPSFDGTAITEATTVGDGLDDSRPESPTEPKPSSVRSDIGMAPSSSRSNFEPPKHQSMREMRDVGDIPMRVGRNLSAELPSAATATPTSTTTTNTAANGDTASTPSQSNVQRHHGPASVFGNIRFPKLNVQFANKNAFSATSKKNAQRAKADIEEMFAADLTKQAQSTPRRKAPVVQATREVDPATMDLKFQSPVDGPPPSVTDASVTASSKGGAGADDSSFVSAQESFASTRSDTNNNFGAAAGGASVVSGNTENTSAATKDGSSTAATSNGVAFDSTMQHQQAKPAFQQPVNKSSALVANGWIEQQRRSKMRTVWKEVLASLVLARRPNEETTLWIQREAVNAISGQKELEALHQIPIKLLEQINYLDYTADNRFTLKVFNSTEEFVFRCATDIAAMNWVMILRKYEQELKQGQPKPQPEPQQPPAQQQLQQHYQQQQHQEQQYAFAQKEQFPHVEEKKGPDHAPQPAGGPPPRLKISELRAICHGAGINTAGMERSELEAAAEEVRRRGTYFSPPPSTNPFATQAPMHPTPPTVPHPAPQPTAQPEPEQQQASSPPPEPQQQRSATPTPTPQPEEPKEQKLSISELRAICHGAGINTIGMERGELEAAAEEVRKRGTYFDPPPGTTNTAPIPSVDSNESRAEEQRKQEEARMREEFRKAEELRARQEELRRRHEAEAAAERQRKEAEEARARQMEEDRRRAEEEARRRQVEEEQHRRRLAEEEHRRRLAAEEEHRRRVAEQQAAEQRRRYAEQQAAWQQQQKAEEERRRAAEQQAAEQRRRHEEALRKQQQWAQAQAQQQQHWQQQQQRQQAWQQQQQQWHQQQQQQQQQQHAWHQQQQQARTKTPPPNQQQQQQQRQSSASAKYANMANKNDDDGQAVLTSIKHEILIHWALHPPQLQMLRPIDQLVMTIHNVYPPALGVPAHDYFKKWKPIARSDVVNAAGLLDDEKLKKAVRKIRFFLHPDKLPKDLTTEQQFMVKMLWDVTSDAWEEFEKRKEDLDWIK